MVSGSGALSTTATAASPVGSYTIAVGQGTLAATKYDFTTFTPGTLTVGTAASMVGLYDPSSSMFLLRDSNDSGFADECSCYRRGQRWVVADSRRLEWRWHTVNGPL